jgi:hypothetical protein
LNDRKHHYDESGLHPRTNRMLNRAR